MKDSKEEETDESTIKNKIIDAIFDITSEKFDPIRAIYTKETIPPYSKTTLYDNVGMFEAKLKIVGSFEKKMNNKKFTKMKIPNTTDASTSRNINRFLPHQLPVQGTKSISIQKKNILSKMELGHGDGPLGLLKKFKDEKIKVKILTRKEKGIRGFITGYIEAYDKHWNIALVDVFEKWKRRKYNFSLDTRCHGTPQDMSKRLKEFGIKIPEIKVKSLNRKYVECTRNIPQLFMRGEQVVLITINKD